MPRGSVLFTAWLTVGFVASWLVLYAFTPAGPLIVLVVWLAYRFLPRVARTRLPEAFGALGGFGLFCLVLANSIDGDPGPLPTLGVTAIVLSIVLYVAAGRRRCARHPAAA